MNKLFVEKTKLLAALAFYILLGWHCFGCRPDKTPGTRKGHKDATLDVAMLERYWNKHPEALIGVRTGEISGIFVIDLDVDAERNLDGTAWLREMEVKHGLLPKCPTTKTPRGGMHLWFKHPSNRAVPCSIGKLAPGVDVKGDGGYVIAPESVSNTGQYTWLVDPRVCPVPAAPDWLLALVCRPADPEPEPESAQPTSPPTKADLPQIRAEIEQQLHSVRESTIGTRNHTLNLAAFVLGKIAATGAVSEASLEEQLHGAARDAGLDEPEARRTIRSGLNAGKLRPWRPHANELPLHQLNRDHFFSVEGKSAFVFKEELDAVTGRRSLRRLYPSTFQMEYSNRTVEVQTSSKPRREKLGKRWMEWPGRRQYETVVFAPGGTVPSNVYNQWQGLAAEPIKGEWTKFRAFVMDVVCAGNPELFEYLSGWCARAVQKPGSPGEVATVLRGKKGTGKTFFAEHFGELFGDHYVEMSHSRHLIGNFNAHLETAIVAFADEAFWAGDKPNEGTLKALITSRQLLFERKGIDAQLGPNFVHLLMASNSDWVVPASMDERRFMMLDVSDANREDHTYFAAIDEEWKHGGREAFLHFLVSFDLSRFNVRRVPQTPALFEQKLLTLGSVEKWYFGMLQSGTNTAGNSQLVPSGHMEGPYWCEWVETQNLYGVYAEFANVDRTRLLSREAFGARLNDLLPPAEPGRKPRTQRGSGKGRAWGYEFPPLDTCRQHFSKRIGFEIEWESAGDVQVPPELRY